VDGGMTRFNHVAGFDDAPFPRTHRGSVLLVGTVFSGRRLDGVLAGRVWRDGVNSTREVARLVAQSRFAPQLQAILLQGIAFAGFNVVDIHALHAMLGIPVAMSPEACASGASSNGPVRWRPWSRYSCNGPAWISRRHGRSCVGTPIMDTCPNPCAVPISSPVASPGGKVGIDPERA